MKDFEEKDRNKNRKEIFYSCFRSRCTDVFIGILWPMEPLALMFNLKSYTR